MSMGRGAAWRLSFGNVFRATTGVVLGLSRSPGWTIYGFTCLQRIRLEAVPQNWQYPTAVRVLLLENGDFRRDFDEAKAFKFMGYRLPAPTSPPVGWIFVQLHLTMGYCLR